MDDVNIMSCLIGRECKLISNYSILNLKKRVLNLILRLHTQYFIILLTLNVTTKRKIEFLN